MKTDIIKTLKIVAVALLLTLGANYVYAWTGPSGNPPSGNVAAPINVGGTNQIKSGALTLGGLVVSGGSVFQGSVRIESGSPGSGKVLTSDASGNATWQAGGASGIQFAQAFRKDGPQDTGTSHTNRPIITVRGPSSAFVPINNAMPYPSSLYATSAFDDLDGVKCATGWELVGCWLVARGGDSDIFPYNNGCITNDFDSSSVQRTELSIACMKTN